MLLGARVGLARAVTGMVMVELLLVAVGLGRLLVNSQANFLAGDVYAVVLVILSEALLLMKLTRWLEHRLAPWVAVP
jgi:ABC-type nitrate/sulfonate/bicarbonate transport system permease component